MKIDSDIIGRLLDGEVPPDQREKALRAIRNDPAWSQEYEDLRAAADLLEREGPHEAPHGFTASVMERIAVRSSSHADRIRDFLFGNRLLRWNVASAVAVAALVAAAVWFAQSQDIGRRDQQTAMQEGTVMVRLSFYAPQAQEVAVAGDFNKWTVGTDRMDRRNGGLWTIDLTLPPGRYSYMFVLDGKAWVTDPGAESFQDDGFGNRNAVMRVKT